MEGTMTTFVEAEAAVINNNHDRMMAQMMGASEKGYMQSDGRIDEWTNGRTNERTKGWMTG